MSVHYKFKSALEYDTVTFDGLHISVKDLKNAIIQQKRIGKNTDFDLQVTNAQTKEVYEDEDTLIPKNTSLLIARIPLVSQTKSKPWEGYGGDATPPSRVDEGGPIAKAVDLSNLDVPEDDKIRAMMSQSTQDYDPSNYMKIRGANQMGTVPPNYRCYKCHQSGHWIKDCPLSQGPEPMEIKKSTGIPRSFMVPVEGPQVQGAMMTPNGSYAVPVLDHQTYTQKQTPAPIIQEEKPEIPEDLLCSICSDLLTDAVMIPCCGNSFCDECIRSCLLESEEHECPDCHERDISPGTLIPNRFLRNSVSNFKNTTGYVKKPVHKPTPPPVIVEETQTTVLEKEPTPPPAAEVKTKEEDAAQTPKVETAEKTVISEADSTEQSKQSTGIDFSKDIDINEPAKNKKSPTLEGPPGVSPKHEDSTKSQPITNMANTPRGHPINTSNRYVQKPPSRERSPRKLVQSRHSPTYTDTSSHIEERPGTPTVDEPGMGSNIVAGHNPVYSTVATTYNNAPPPGVMPPMMGMGPAPHMQPPPAIPYSSGQPPPGVYPPQPQGPMPNFRLPPPNASAAPYMPPGSYNVPPRPMFDATRPPMQGSTGYAPSYGVTQRLSRGRDYLPAQTRTLRGRTPPGIIDDPLEAFNRMLREKDERERRAKQRKGRSYSRSSSRSYSRSPRRMRSRSPRRRISRSRSRSFSISRSRSRSFSPSVRGSPSFRDFSPRNSPRKGTQTRYRSPIRSPPRYRYKDTHASDRSRDRDFDRDRDRDYSSRGDRGYSRDRDFRERDREPRDRDYHYYDSYDRDRNRNKSSWNHQSMVRSTATDGYYPPPEIHPQTQPPPYVQPSNRYPPRDTYPPYIGKNDSQHNLPPFQQHQQQAPPLHMPPRRYDDVVPPGTEQPPVPGLEPTPRFEDRFNNYEQENQQQSERYTSPPREHRDNKESDSRRVERRDNSQADRSKERRYDRYSRSPEKNKKENQSDDEKTKKSKEKKKKKEKKESDKKKRKEKREKHEKHKKSDEKEKRNKEAAKSSDTQTKNEPEESKKELDNKSTNQELIQTADCSKEVVKSQSVEETKVPEKTQDLYGDILTEGIDSNVVANYGKIEDTNEESESRDISKTEEVEEDVSKEYEDSEKDILELHTNEAELKAELELKNEMLAPLPEKSKWEMDEEVISGQNPSAPIDTYKMEIKVDKSGKVTNEVLKRAENAIFAKAINAIRPIEIKKISLDRAKLYSGERDKDKKLEDMDVRNIHVTISGSGYEDDAHAPTAETKHVESTVQPPIRLSVKERLGCKVDDLDRIVKVEKPYEKNRSCSLSPLSKRAYEGNRNYSQGERRVEVEERRRQEEKLRHGSRTGHHRNYRNTSEGTERKDMRREDYSRRDSRRYIDRRNDNRRRDEGYRKNDGHYRDDKRTATTHFRSSNDENAKRRKRSRSRSDSNDKLEKSRNKKKDKKQKKEKTKKHKKDETADEKNKNDESKNKIEETDQKQPKPVTDRRKPTLDEANFEPDYDLESESEKDEDGKAENKKRIASKSPDLEAKKKIKVEEKKKVSSSSDSSDSSSGDDKKKKKHRKHKKKKSRKDSSSSSSDSDSDSSDEDRRKRRKHKKKMKKKKKSKHK